VTVAVDPAVAAGGDYEGYVRFINESNPEDSYRVPFLFVHRLPVSELTLSDSFLGTAANTLTKGVMATVVGGWSFGRQVLLAFGVTLAVGAGALAVTHWP